MRWILEPRLLISSINEVFYWTILIDHVSNSGHDWKVAELDLLVFIRRLSGLCWRFSGFRSRRLWDRERLRKRSSNRLNRLLIYFLLMDCLEKWHPSSWMKYSLSLTTILPLYSFLPFPIFERAPIQIQRDQIIIDQKQLKKNSNSKSSEIKT